MMDLSIIIVNFNARDLLRGCLRSIYLNLKDLKFEVIVVDNASKDGSAEMVKQEVPKVKLIENRTNIGFAAANNKGIKVSRGKYILFLNSDAELMDDSIKELVKLMEKDQRIGIVGCKLLYGDRTLQPSCGPQLSQMTFIRQLVHGIERGKYYLSGYDKEREVGWCTGACLLIRKEALDEVGAFDENYFMYYEDNDLCLRLKKKGWKVIYSPKASVMHYKAKSRKNVTAEEEERLVVENIKSYIYFYKKHFNILMRFVLRAMIFIYYGLKLLAGSLLYVIGKRYPLRTYIKCILISLK